LYTAVIEPDNTYRILVDGEEKQSGKIEEDWDILPPKKIKDPQVSKPSSWVDERMIDDPSDKKPEGYDDIPSEIADPDASKPDDWDDELDGDWEAPRIANPEFKGEWAPKKIDNPEYKGEWVHPEIDNPDYHEDSNLYAYDSFGGIGIDIWQVKAGTIFDNFLITDDFSTAESHFEEVKKRREGERKVKEERDKEEAEKRAAEAKEKPAAAHETTDSDESGDEHAGHDHGEHEDL
jgi:calreticulin